MMPRVSIIIPAYNSGKYIGECLDSLMAQTFQEWEAIIVVAPSTDNTVEEVLKYVSPPKINAIWERQKTNCATARNRGVATSLGDYVSFLDADDWLEPDNLATMVKYLDDNLFLEWCASYQEIHVGDEIHLIKDLPGTTNEIGGIGGCLYSRYLLHEIEQKYGYIFDERLNHTDDGDLTLRVRHYPAGLIPLVLSHYRWNEEGLTATTRSTEQSWGIVKMCARRGAWEFLPYHLKNLVACIAVEKFGLNVVNKEMKKE